MNINPQLLYEAFDLLVLGKNNYGNNKTINVDTHSLKKMEDF